MFSIFIYLFIFDQTQFSFIKLNMSNIMTVVTEHFTHPGHKLVQLESKKEYLCSCCKTLGSGKTFQCSSCNAFNMHEFCAKCPVQLSTFMHPLHRLSLVVRTAHGMRANKCTCDVCEDDLEGFFLSVQRLRFWSTFSMHSIASKLEACTSCWPPFGVTEVNTGCSLVLVASVKVFVNLGTIGVGNVIVLIFIWIVWW